MKRTFLENIKHYSELGYDITLTSIYGKDAVRMVKRYSVPAERALICEQIVDHDEIGDNDYTFDFFNYMYENIQNQEQTKKYYESNYLTFL